MTPPDGMVRSTAQLDPTILAGLGHVGRAFLQQLGAGRQAVNFQLRRTLYGALGECTMRYLNSPGRPAGWISLVNVPW